jgi:hypothetical protein
MSIMGLLLRLAPWIGVVRPIYADAGGAGSNKIVVNPGSPASVLDAPSRGDSGTAAATLTNRLHSAR